MEDKRKKRVRYKLKKVTSRKRLTVFRSNKHLYAQVIDDSVGKTLASASSKEKDFDLFFRAKREENFNFKYPNFKKKSSVDQERCASRSALC